MASITKRLCCTESQLARGRDARDTKQSISAAREPEQPLCQLQGHLDGAGSAEAAGVTGAMQHKGGSVAESPGAAGAGGGSLMSPSLSFSPLDASSQKSLCCSEAGGCEGPVLLK